MNSIKCSQCGLVNFAEALSCKRCSCQLQNNSQTAYQTHGGFNQPPPNNYKSLNPYENQPGSDADTSAAVRKMFFGALWAGGGTIATVLSYGSASGGGKYFVFWGAILFGAVDFLIGLNAYFSSKS